MDAALYINLSDFGKDGIHYTGLIILSLISLHYIFALLWVL